MGGKLLVSTACSSGRAGPVHPFGVFPHDTLVASSCFCLCALGCSVPAVPLLPLLQQNHSWPALGSGFCFDPVLNTERLLASGCASALH